MGGRSPRARVYLSRAAGRKPRHAAVANLQAEMKRKVAEARKMDGENSQKAGEAFLAENKTKEGVVTLPSGLQYKILKVGEGKKPVDGEMVER